MERNNNVFKFQKTKMIVSGKGPNTNFTNKMYTVDSSFRPTLSSTLSLPRNFEKQSSAASVASSQRSIYYRRDTSPTDSVLSDLQPRNFHQPLYSRGYSQRLVNNDRAVSPSASMRSIGSTVSRADTVKSCIHTIQNCSLTEDEWKMIKHAVNRNIEFKKKTRKRMSMQTSVKHFQNRFEDDGEQGSCSSNSSDDRTGYSWRQFPQTNGLLQNENTLYRQNNAMCGPRNTFFSQKYTSGQANISSMHRKALNASIFSTKSMQNVTMMSQRDRFRGGFQFPSEKFKRSTLYEEHQQGKSKLFPKADCANKKINLQRDWIDEVSDEDENIFLDTKVKQKSGKRKAESIGDIPTPVTKKSKTCSSNDKLKKQTQNIDNHEKNEFEFVKPQFPFRKFAPVKLREEMISKSVGIPDLLCSTQENEISPPQPVQAPSPEPHAEPEEDNPELTTSDMSTRPSFMKRKLFTQTLDVTERINNSFDNGSANSPQTNIYGALSKEKHKTRKLVTSQSLLSRDVNQDDDNLLDLIHKIVPPNQVNSTITAKTTKPRVSETKNGDDIWDVSSIILTCNRDSVSETYTDDELFKVSVNDTKSKPQEKPVSKKNLQQNIKIDNVKDVGNTNTRNVGNIKPPSARNVKSRSNANEINVNKTKDVDNIKTTHNKNIKDVVDQKLPNCKDDVSRKKCKDLDTKQNTNNNNNKDVESLLPAAPRMDTEKPCLATRVMNIRSCVDAFWDTDDSDSECAARRLPSPQKHPHTDLTQNRGINPKQSGPDTQPISSTKVTKTNKTPLVVLQELEKILNKQTSKKFTNKTQSKLKKNCDGNPQPEKMVQNNNGTPNPSLRSRRLKNLSAALESANNTDLKENDTTLKENTPTVTKVQKKQTTQKKRTQDKNNKTKATEIAKSRNKKENDSMIDNSKKRAETPKRPNRTSKPQKPNQHLMKIDIFKVLRSRTIDMSSSFNSDNFELTHSRTRKSRTPSKRISFNMSKNMPANNKNMQANKKIRNRATKS